MHLGPMARYALTYIAASAALLSVERDAKATYTWTSIAITDSVFGASGPASIPAPTGEPILGDNYVPFTPFVYGANADDVPLFGFYILGPASSGGNYQPWGWNLNAWKSYDDYFWGLNFDVDGDYEFSWTTSGDVGYQGTFASSWHTNIWSTSFTMVAACEGGSSSSDVISWYTHVGVSTTQTWLGDPGTPTDWGNGKFVANDMFSQTGGCSPSGTYSVDASAAVQHPRYVATPTGHWVEDTYSTVIANSSGVCGGTGSGTLYAIQIAAKDGALYALGGDSTQGYSGGPGTVYYYYDALCWQPVGTGSGTPQGNVVSIAVDNSGSAAADSITSEFGPYAVWAVDNSSNIWAACSGSSCTALDTLVTAP
jgi:hypothetical protein